MIEIGKRQTLTASKRTMFGMYLTDNTDRMSEGEKEVLLPSKYVPSDLEIMDPIEVFIYRDSEDRLVATTDDPLIHLGETATLRVKDVSQIGAFLDWGLEKDLFLPFREQKGRPEAGDMISVKLYVDKSGRLSATMWVSDEEKKVGNYERNSNNLKRLLKKNNGFLPINDKSSPEEIKSLTNMSKNEFKKAVGSLYKLRQITIEENGIRTIK